ncbi:6-phosphogluconolactonase [Balamuthia mandrillaris]
MEQQQQQQDSPKVVVSEDGNALARALAEYVAEVSRKAVESNGKFTVALSGGSLPKLLAQDLIQEPFLSAVEWTKWHVFFADERYVTLDDPESNYRLCKEALFDHVPLPPSQIYTLDHSLPLPQAAQAYQDTLQKVISSSSTSTFPSFDLILLGMGPDGHTASLFPSHPLLQESALAVGFVEDSPKPPPQRITFTLPLLRQARRVAFVATGSAKQEPLARILEGRERTEEVPASLVGGAQQEDLRWFVDKEATAKCSRL